MAKFVIYDGEVIEAQIIGKMGKGYDTLYEVVEYPNGARFWIHQSWKLD